MDQVVYFKNRFPSRYVVISKQAAMSGRIFDQPFHDMLVVVEKLDVERLKIFCGVGREEHGFDVIAQSLLHYSYICLAGPLIQEHEGLTVAYGLFQFSEVFTCQMFHAFS